MVGRSLAFSRQSADAAKPNARTLEAPSASSDIGLPCLREPIGTTFEVGLGEWNRLEAVATFAPNSIEYLPHGPHHDAQTPN